MNISAQGPFTVAMVKCTQSVVPPFHGLEPGLSLAYDSGRGNGFVGVGWRLAGPSLIERGSIRRGAPRTREIV